MEQIRFFFIISVDNLLYQGMFLPKVVPYFLTSEVFGLV